MCSQGRKTSWASGNSWEEGTLLCLEARETCRNCHLPQGQESKTNTIPALLHLCLALEQYVFVIKHAYWKEGKSRKSSKILFYETINWSAFKKMLLIKEIMWRRSTWYGLRTTMQILHIEVTCHKTDPREGIVTVCQGQGHIQLQCLPGIPEQLSTAKCNVTQHKLWKDARTWPGLLGINPKKQTCIKISVQKRFLTSCIKGMKQKLNEHLTPENWSNEGWHIMWQMPAPSTITFQMNISIQGNCLWYKVEKGYNSVLLYLLHWKEMRRLCMKYRPPGGGLAWNSYFLLDNLYFPSFHNKKEL